MAENELLTPGEVAMMFRVNPKTVTRWARAGKISAVRTLGGHRRFRASEIRRVLQEVGDLPASWVATRIGLTCLPPVGRVPIL
jgi:excisionase family DNA binding protein